MVNKMNYLALVLTLVNLISSLELILEAPMALLLLGYITLISELGF